MKKLWMLLAFLIHAAAGMAQQKAADTAPYIKYPTLPAFNLLMPDSTTIFNTFYIPEGKPTILLFFSPDCEHCKTVTEHLLGKMDSLSGVQFYLFTPMKLSMLRTFSEELKLKQYPNIVVGRDYQYFFPTFYAIDHVPYLVLYDRKKKLVKMYDGHVKMDELIRAVNAL